MVVSSKPPLPQSCPHPVLPPSFQYSRPCLRHFGLEFEPFTVLVGYVPGPSSRLSIPFPSPPPLSLFLLVRDFGLDVGVFRMLVGYTLCPYVLYPIP